MTDAGISYGFHGLTYSHIASQLRTRYGPAAGGKVIVAHLGSGASLCAMNAGISVGFSTLDGLVMSTRCGALNPGVTLHLLNDRKLQTDDWSPFSTSNPACSECRGYPVICDANRLR
ncbi:hypothetical protein [Mesorhizobium sp. M0058]|uniref:hypothetical protein n=1 Tax=Mesorhizobium sp. M0058 TaxID=2956865 RepID=UPI00333577B5